MGGKERRKTREKVRVNKKSKLNRKNKEMEKRDREKKWPGAQTPSIAKKHWPPTRASFWRTPK